MKYKKNLFYLFVSTFLIGSTMFGMSTFNKLADKVKKVSQMTQDQVENLKNQLIDQAKKAVKANDQKLLTLAKNALDKAVASPLLPQTIKNKLQSFRNMVNQALQKRTSGATTTTTVAQGEKAYVPVAEIRPGQSRYAAPNVDQKVAKMQKSKGKFADGKSALNIDEKAIPVVKGPFTDKPYVLIDGHHDVLAAIELGSTEIPIVVKKDMSMLNEKEFYKQAANQGLVYYNDINGNPPATYPTTFKQLTDDPYRWFATVITRKCANRQAAESTSEAKKDSYAYQYPVLAKSDVKGEDTPFIEFIVANVLHKAFQSPELLQFNNEIQQKSNDPSQQVVEAAREALSKHFKNRSDLPQIRLIPTPVVYTQVNNGAICSTPDFNPKSGK